MSHDDDGRSTMQGSTTGGSTMRDVSHTNPYTNETLGRLFQRGPAVADGGESRGRRDDDSGRDRSANSMRDVDHTPRDLNVNTVWARGDRHGVAGDD